LKALVIWLWSANTAHEILIVKGVYDALIIYFCDYAHLQILIPEFLWALLLTSLVAITSQTFFTYRIWRFNNQRWYYWAMLVPVCLFQLGGSLAFAALGTITLTGAGITASAPAALYLSIQVVAAAADVAIAAGLVVLLIKNRERALKGSRSILQKLLIMTINTGVWTALFSIFTFALYIAFKGTFICATLYFPLCPLYCNTVLANLNARHFLEVRSAVAESETIDTTYNVGPTFVGPRSTVGTQSEWTDETDPSLTVKVEVKKSVHDDGEPALGARGSKFGSEKQ